MGDNRLPSTEGARELDFVILCITLESMRKIINISLPEELHNKVSKEVKEGGYATKSEFFRDLLRLWEEEKLLREIRVSQAEMLAGKGKTLRSLKSLR